MIRQRQPSVPIAEVRRLATVYGSEDIEQCMKQVLSEKVNSCYSGDDPAEVMNVLAKAGFVRDRMQQGCSLSEAMRELGKRMRIMANI
jgi:hypothetical protein